MPPKRPPPSPAKAKGKGKKAQPSIASFFSPPKKRAAEVVEVADSSDDDIVAIDAVIPKKPRLEVENGRTGDQAKAQDTTVVMSEVDMKPVEVTPVKADSEGASKTEPETDEELARRLATEWEIEDRGSNPTAIHDAAMAGLERTEVKPKLEAPPGAANLSPPTAKAKVHPMFARPQPEAGPSRLRDEKSSTAAKEVKVKEEERKTLTAARAAPVEPIDFDLDALLFRPDTVDISRWPQGRLPYSVLVGVYVQVASTRSRLTIVRVLTK